MNSFVDVCNYLYKHVLLLFPTPIFRLFRIISGYSLPYHTNVCRVKLNVMKGF